jgi:hypothetical protein
MLLFSAGSTSCSRMQAFVGDGVFAEAFHDLCAALEHDSD